MIPKRATLKLWPYVLLTIIIVDGVLYGVTNTTIEQVAVGKQSFWTYILSPKVIIPTVTVAIAFIYALWRTSRPKFEDDPWPEQSKWTDVKKETVLSRLKERTPNGLYYALVDFACLPFYDEELIGELSAVVGKRGIYADCNYLDHEMRCRVARFLHLAVDRNRRWHKGCLNHGGAKMSPFIEIYSECSFCKALSPSQNWFSRFITHFEKFFSKFNLEKHSK